MISVCMAVFNGEKYIRQQLQSILDQSRRPDEVILCDDCSTDSTAEIIGRFIEENKQEGIWKLYRNDKNKGYPGNFYYAMSLCAGDIVFLADQDDLWERDKIQDMAAVMERHPEIFLLSSKWGIVDGDGAVLRTARKPGQRDDREKTGLSGQISVKDILYEYVWPGMSMCYRRSLGVKACGRAGNTALAHDVALALTAAEEGGFYAWDEVCQFHRRHGNNVAMEEHRAGKLLNKARKQEEIRRYLSMLNEIERSACLQNKENREEAALKREIMEERGKNLRQGSRYKILMQYFRYRRHIRLKTVICDLLICRQHV